MPALGHLAHAYARVYQSMDCDRHFMARLQWTEAIDALWRSGERDIAVMAEDGLASSHGHPWNGRELLAAIDKRLASREIWDYLTERTQIPG